MAYSEEADLLLDGVLIGSRIDKQKFIDGAADEMDSKLGWLYNTPILIDGDDAVDPVIPPLPRHEALLLKNINNKLASGRLILTLDIAGEGTTLHAYGLRLVKEAMDELLLIANGDLDLHAPKNVDPAVPVLDRTPGISNYDEESLLLGFERTVHASEPWSTTPGAAPAVPRPIPWYAYREPAG